MFCCSLSDDPEGWVRGTEIREGLWAAYLESTLFLNKTKQNKVQRKLYSFPFAFLSMCDAVNIVAFL